MLSLLEYQPLHPYGVQRLLKQWGKEAVVNVGQRATLYKMMDRLLGEGLIAVKETERDHQYPERTVYEITDEGRAVARDWMRDMLSHRKAEYPEFPAALSFVPMLSPTGLLQFLEQRQEQLTASLAAQEAALTQSVAMQLPKVTLLDDEYLRDVTAVELKWVSRTVADLRSKRLSWSAEELFAAAARVDG